ncbi:MAG TPA: hypothetical protein VFN13_06765 [Rudaea sp.]|nr:hypothetical protein [Rudaea sp.]
MTKSNSTAASLKHKLHCKGETHSESSRVRIHRAISWLARAEREGADPDARFVFLWIAFNAAYAKAFGGEESQRAQLGAFFTRLASIDTDRQLAALMLKQFSGPVRTLIANKFVFEPFWKALRDHDATQQWERQFQASSTFATRAVLDGKTDLVLSVVFDRLYVLRNQLLHGGATWNSRANRTQVKGGANLMLAVIPVVIELMLDHPEVDFGEILYPVV